VGRRWEGAVVGELADGCASPRAEGRGHSLRAEAERQTTGVVAVGEEAPGSTAEGC